MKIRKTDLMVLNFKKEASVYILWGFLYNISTVIIFLNTAT